MRKFLLSLACSLLAAGLVLAAEVTLVKFDATSKVLTVRDGDAEKTYKLTDNTKYATVDQDGKATPATQAALIKVLTAEKSVGRKFEIKTDKDEVTELSVKVERKAKDKRK